MPEPHRDEIAKLEALFAANPDGRIFTHLAEAYRKAGELTRARETVEQGLERHAEYPSAHVVLGRVLWDLGEVDGAGQAFRRVLELDPENRVALRALGDLARETGRAAEALDHYRALLLLDPSDMEVEELTRTVESEAGGAGAIDFAAATDVEQVDSGGTSEIVLDSFVAEDDDDAGEPDVVELAVGPDGLESAVEDAAVELDGFESTVEDAAVELDGFESVLLDSDPAEDAGSIEDTSPAAGLDLEIAAADEFDAGEDPGVGGDPGIAMDLEAGADLTIEEGVPAVDGLETAGDFEVGDLGSAGDLGVGDAFGTELVSDSQAEATGGPIEVELAPISEVPGEVDQGVEGLDPETLELDDWGADSNEGGEEMALETSAVDDALTFETGPDDEDSIDAPILDTGVADQELILETNAADEELVLGTNAADEDLILETNAAGEGLILETSAAGDAPTIEAEAGEEEVILTGPPEEIETSDDVFGVAALDPGAVERSEGVLDLDEREIELSGEEIGPVLETLEPGESEIQLDAAGIELSGADIELGDTDPELSDTGLELSDTDLELDESDIDLGVEEVGLEAGAAESDAEAIELTPTEIESEADGSDESEATRFDAAEIALDATEIELGEMDIEPEGDSQSAEEFVALGEDEIVVGADEPLEAATPGEPAVGDADFDGPVVTETMGDLYARQGLYDRAAEVYRDLLTRRPGDERLAAKLAEVERAAVEPGHDGVDVEATQVEAVDSSTSPDQGLAEEPTIGEYLRALLVFPGSGPSSAVQESRAGVVDSEPAAVESTAAEDDVSVLLLDESAVVDEEAGEEDEYDRLFGGAAETPDAASQDAEQETRTATGSGGSAESDEAAGRESGTSADTDEDLEMFRTWLQNLKQ